MDSVVIAIAIAVTIIQAWQGYAGGISSQWTLGVIFMTGCLPVVFLFVSSGFEDRESTSNPSRVDHGLFAVALAIGIYFWVGADYFTMRIPGLVNQLSGLDMVLAGVYVLLVLEAARRCVGPSLVILALIMISYVLLGDSMGSMLAHRDISFHRLLDESIYTVNGVFGEAMGVVATYGFLFILFGAIFEQSGGGKWFFDVSAAITGRYAGGPAKVAVVSSGLFGMISGSPAADCYATGSVTIPMMIKTGYKRYFAGAVEAVASTGGSIMPPVMGAVAFLAADMMGRPYIDIAKASALPALLYYLGTFIQVHCRANREGLVGFDRSEIPGFFKSLFGGWYFLIPFTLLVYLIAIGYTPSYVAVLASVAALALAALARRISFGLLLLMLREILVRIAPVTGAVAAAGLVVGAINLVGLGGKFANFVFTLGSTSLPLALLCSAVVCIILGMGMPSVSAFVLAGALLAPPLIKLGLPELPTYLFLIYYSVLSGITPPVATTAYVCATLAHDNPMKIGWAACRLGFIAFVLPFIFVYNQALILVGSTGEIIEAFLSSVIGCTAMAVAVEGFWFFKLPWWARIMLSVGGLLLLIPGLITDLAGLAIVGMAVYILKTRCAKQEVRTGQVTIEKMQADLVEAVDE